MDHSTAPVEAQPTEPQPAPGPDAPAQTAPAPEQAADAAAQPAPAAYPGYPSHPAQPQATPQPWQSHQIAPAYGLPPVPYAPSPYGGKSSRPGLVIAVISLIVSGIALVSVFGMAMFTFGGFPGPAGPGGSMAPLTGKVPAVSPSTSLAADRLSSQVSLRLEDDGWSINEMTCPPTRKVAQGVVTVCHANADDGQWAVVVYFEDDQGTYTLNVF